MALVNLDEEQLEDPEPILAPVREAFGDVDPNLVMGLCIQLEAEAAMLDEESRAEMLDALGLGEGALPNFLQTAYHARPAHVLHHRREGDPGVDVPCRVQGAAGPGVIHTDFERGFIRVETIQWDELLEPARGPRPARPASCGSRARTTRSPTATSSSSASTCERSWRADGEVLRIVTLPPGRVSRVVWRAASTIEAAAGAFAAWGVGAGDRIEVR
jgi:hypothetical protein